MNEIQKRARRKAEEAHWRLFQSRNHVKDLQQIYDTVKGSLHMAKLQLEIYEERNQKAKNEYNAVMMNE